MEAAVSAAMTADVEEESKNVKPVAAQAHADPHEGIPQPCVVCSRVTLEKLPCPCPECVRLCSACMLQIFQKQSNTIKCPACNWTANKETLAQYVMSPAMQDTWFAIPNGVDPEYNDFPPHDDSFDAEYDTALDANVHHPDHPFLRADGIMEFPWFPLPVGGVRRRLQFKMKFAEDVQTLMNHPIVHSVNYTSISEETVGQALKRFCWFEVPTSLNFMHGSVRLQPTMESLFCDLVEGCGNDFSVNMTTGITDQAPEAYFQDRVAQYECHDITVHGKFNLVLQGILGYIDMNELRHVLECEVPSDRSLFFLDMNGEKTSLIGLNGAVADIFGIYDASVLWMRSRTILSFQKC